MCLGNREGEGKENVDHNKISCIKSFVKVNLIRTVSRQFHYYFSRKSIPKINQTGGFPRLRNERRWERYKHRKQY